MGGVPTIGVSAVLLNVTAIDPTDDGFLTVYPKLPRGVANPADPIRLFDDQSSFLPNYPNSSNLNFVAGDIVPNLVLARVGAGGKIRLEELRRADQRRPPTSSAGSTPAPAAATASPASRPTRAARHPRQHGGHRRPVRQRRAAATSRWPRRRAGLCPGAPRAVVLNVTAVNPTSNGYVTVWPTGISDGPSRPA